MLSYFFVVVVAPTTTIKKSRKQKRKKAIQVRSQIEFMKNKSRRSRKR